MKHKKPYWVVWIHKLNQFHPVGDMVELLTWKDRYKTEKSRDMAVKARIKQGHEIKFIGSD